MLLASHQISSQFDSVMYGLLEILLVVVNSKSWYDKRGQGSSCHTHRVYSAVFCTMASTESSEWIAAGPSDYMTEAWHDFPPAMWQSGASPLSPTLLAMLDWDVSLHPVFASCDIMLCMTLYMTLYDIVPSILVAGSAKNSSR